MESQVVAQPRGHRTYEHDPQNAGLHSEDEDHHEKKSVLKMVKVKAKKLKDTITKHSHGHGHDHDQHEGQYSTPDDHDHDEEDEEMAEDPEIHGAPIYESAAVMSGVSSVMPMAMEKDGYGLEGNQGRNKMNFGDTTVMDDDIRTPANTLQVLTPSAPRKTQHYTDPTGTFIHGQQGKKTDQDWPTVNLAAPVGLEKDPHAPDSEGQYSPNYQSKVTDPTGSGGKEIDVAPITSSLGKMNVNDETGLDQNIPTETHGGVSHLPTGSHDHFSPQTQPGQGGYTEKISNATAAVAEKAMAAKDLVALKLGYGNQDQAQEQQEGNFGDTRAEHTGYTEKISSAATEIAEKAASAKDVVASKLGYGKTDETTSPEKDTGMETTKPASTKKGIVDTVTEKLTPAYAKVAGASGIVTSKAKVTSSGSTDQVKEGASVQQDKGMSVKEYLGEKLKPGEEDKALLEMISGALRKKKEGEGEKGKVVGKVTESEEVRARLGGGEKEGEISESLRGESSSPGKAVVDKLKGTVGSWFGKSEAASGTPQPHDDPNLRREENGGEERRLQESTP